MVSKREVGRTCRACGSRVALDVLSCECGQKFYRAPLTSVFDLVFYGLVFGSIVGLWYLFVDWDRRPIVLVGLLGFVGVGFGLAALQNTLWPGPPLPKGHGPLSYEEESQLRAFYAAELPSMRREVFGWISPVLTVIAAGSGVWLLASPPETARSWVAVPAAASLWIVSALVTYWAKYRTDRPRLK
jgi:hypothetical protein